MDAVLTEKEDDWQLKYNLLTQDYEQKWGLSMRLQEQIVALTEMVHKGQGMANEINILTKENNALTAERDRLWSDINITEAALGISGIYATKERQIVALTAENERLRVRLRTHGDIETDKEDALRGGESEVP